MSSEKVSVVMPACNHERFVGAAVNSVSINRSRGGMNESPTILDPRPKVRYDPGDERGGAPYFAIDRF